MGPADGRSEMLASRSMTSPLFAALVNAAASHISEQDDVHNGSVFHPAAVVFPAALAAAQHIGASGRDVHRRFCRRLRGRHPRRRVPRPLALPRLPHHRHRRHDRSSRGDGAVARPRLFGDAQRDRLCRHAGCRPVGVPARRCRLQAAPHRQGRSRRADRSVSCTRWLHRREAHPRRRARHGRRHVERCRSGKTCRSPRHAMGAARNVLQVSRFVPPHPSGSRRAARGDRGERSCGQPTSPR